MKAGKLPYLFLCGIISIVTIHLWAADNSGSSRSANPLVQDYKLFDVNNISAWITNYGSFFRNPLTGNSGFEWPKGSGIFAIYAAGPWIGAKVNGESRVAIAEYSYEFVSGTINSVTHLPNNPSLSRYQVYKYASGEIPDPEAIEDGCPSEVIGDQMLWTVFNDADSAQHIIFDSMPLGLEIQQTVFGYLQAGPLGNAVFLRWLLINKSINTLDSTYLSIWTDPDLGDSGDDLIGCDSSLSLGFCYNGSNFDGEYGDHPPAVGYLLLQGPTVFSSGDTAIFLGNTKADYKNLPMTSFIYWIGSNTNNGNPQTAQEVYHYMQARWRDGTHVTYGGLGTNPSTPNANYMFSGDPISGLGWLDDVPADKRFIMNTGPFNMAPGDSQEVIFAVYILRGTSNLNSLTLLKQTNSIMHSVYNSDFVGLKDKKEMVIENYLMQNYPNPFNSRTTFKYQLPIPRTVHLDIFNAAGQRVATLVNEPQEPDEYEVVWDASGQASGIYFARLRVAQYRFTKKLLLLK
jgi:hypothetical protein